MRAPFYFRFGLGKKSSLHHHAHLNNVFQLIECFRLRLLHFSVGVDDLVHVGIDFILLGELNGLKCLNVSLMIVSIFDLSTASYCFSARASLPAMSVSPGKQPRDPVGDHLLLGRMINAVGMGHVDIQEQDEIGEAVVNDHKSNIVKAEKLKIGPVLPITLLFFSRCTI